RGVTETEGPRFRPVEGKLDLTALEERILAFWDEADVFRRSIEQREGAPEWVFYDGPPTANARPHIGHALTRAFKDVYPRYRTMTGHLVHRKAGWDCHGLPVEIEVEKEIGTSGKQDIEAYGVAAFNERCRASVRRYVQDWERLTRRIGFWIDLSDAYWTMDPRYVESVWWSLQRLHERGLLVEADKVTAYCPRCGTALSDAEVALGYEAVEDPSVFVRFPIVEAADPSLVGASLLIWTTTPWTLPSNTGVGVAPDADYAEVRVDGQRVIVAAALRAAAVGDGAAVDRTLRGADLVGARYEPPYPNVEDAHVVVAGDFVSLDDGSGIVHLAPAFGEVDLAVGREQGWPMFKPVGDDGRFTDLGPPFVRGRFVKDADPSIVEDLRERGLLLRDGTIEHTYPFCWRCGTPLLYYARTSWYVRTTAVKERLLAVNDGVGWYPDHIKHGRYGNWLENNVDWALSRERYWGTPLPIWRCAAGHATAVGSLTELGALAGRDLADLDPHRPYIDEVTIGCPTCGEEARRVPEVIDTWYDSGAMPFAQWGYHPELQRGAEAFERRFPADFISEAIDQTRGWFYTLMAEGVLLFDSTAYRNVVCFGFIVDEDGRKMSKSLGNVIDPLAVMERHGADALRWVLLTSGSPWSSRRLGDTVLEEAVRRFFLTWWNVYGFFVLYANAEGFDPEADEPPPPASRPLLDRWILSRLAGTVRTVREGMDGYDVTGAGRAIEAFVEDLSNWYVRRSRRRFWNPAGVGGADTRAAFHTLSGCLRTTAELLAPFVPFLAEEIWSNLAAGRDGRPDSVHLADYPAVHEALIDPGLDEAMALARRVVELGRRVRTETKTRTRQPLSEAVVHAPGVRLDLAPLLDTIAEELNVKRVRLAEATETFGGWAAKPDFKVLGPRLGRRVQGVARTLGADPDLARRLGEGESVEVRPDDGPAVTIGPGDVQLSRDVRAGWGVATEGGLTVALELEITPELRLEGLAREVVRLVQDARKASGLEVTDRIVLGLEATGDAASAIEAHRDTVAGETLAVEIHAAPVDDDRHESRVDGDGVVVSLRRSE
ncbi:MAG TPA: isoleucine--tRNA ligase, partial [Actinomycetota bacterium]|nr:isoleucine--tRNA ligase [Actinomycetota bacterium]